MEYAWSYAAASAPLTSHLYRQPKPGRPDRSNSTRAVPASSTKRTRIPGHSRASSSTGSSRSKSSYEFPRYSLQQDPPQSPRSSTIGSGRIQGHPAGVTAAATAPAAPAPPPASQASPASPAYPARPGSRGGTASRASSDLDQQWERMPASIKYQNKQLPATPRVESLETVTKYNSASSSISEPSLTPGSPTSPKAAKPPRNTNLPPPSPAVVAYIQQRQLLQHAAMVPDSGALTRLAGTAATPFSRADSLSSLSGATTRSRSTMVSSEHASGSESSSHQKRPFIVRNGRTYLSDPSLPYPLPVDLAELHRQSLRTLLLFQLFGGPVCSPAFANKPPSRVLEVGCGSGFWSMMCHRYYARHGHSSISFTGIDVAPIPAGTSNSGGGKNDAGNRASSSSTTSTLVNDGRPDKDMKWRFVQHDMRRLPWPFSNDEFDLVMVKDLSLAAPMGIQQSLIDEYIRILRPGGTLEIWESDHTIRMLRPHVPEPASAGANRDEDEDEHEAAASLGAYVMTANTPLSAPLNNFLVEYNSWLSKALEGRNLSPVPCTTIESMLVQEDENLTNIGFRRLAVPLSEVRWEREGVGVVVTKDGKSYIETKGKAPEGREGRKTLTAGQAALRRTALLTVVQLIQSLEPILREISGKSQDEWDVWQGKMMNDLMKENGTSWGECLEIGAWWARKKKA